MHLASSVRKVAPYNCRRKLPLSVLIVSSKDCKGMLLTKYCRQSRFTDKNAPGLNLALDEDFQTSNCFTELIRGYMMGAVEPYTMMGLQPTGATRVTLEVIIPSPTGLTPEKWKQTATLCPLDWPSNYSLLRLWHTTKSFPVCCTTQAANFFFLECGRCRTVARSLHEHKR